MPKYTLDLGPAEYAPVADRLALFHERFPDGRVITELMSKTDEEVVFKASLFRNSGELVAAATGWASERFGDGEVNTVACLENTETSAVGRALANLGFLASRRRPCAEEMLKAQRVRERLVSPDPATGSTARDVLDQADAASSDLQARADRISDLLRLLDVAVRAGARTDRIESLKSRVLKSDGSAREIERLEQRVRTWIKRHRRSLT